MNLKSIAIILLTLFCLSCKHIPTEVAIQRPLKLSAATTSGTAPVDIVFTGTFNAYTDTTKVFIPETFFWCIPGRTLIPYQLSDIPVAAKRVYVDTVKFPSSGDYRVFLLLQTTYGPTYSDTIQVSIQ